MDTPENRKRKLSPFLVIAGCLSTFVLAIGMTPAFSSFSASLQNTTNTLGTGILVMQETNGARTVVCNSTDGNSISTNASTCATINKYGGDVAMYPGESISTVITVRNVGVLDAAAFSLTPGVCTQSAAGPFTGTAVDMCARTRVSVESGPTTIFSGTAMAFGSAGTIDVLGRLALPKIAAGTTTTFTFTVTVDSGIDNPYQGITISQPMTWAYGA